MSMHTLGDILQAKVDELPGDIKVIRTYVNDTLVLRYEWLYKNIDQIRVIFAMIYTEVIKVNAPTYIFGLIDIPYLCYVIS